MTRNAMGGAPRGGLRNAAGTMAPYAATRRGGMLGAGQARDYLVPRARRAATAARVRYDQGLAPRLERAKTAAGPAGRQARTRSAAAMAALRGDVTPREISAVLRRRERRARAGRMATRLTILGLAAGAAYAAWKWWEQQSSPDWLMESEPATEVPPEEDEAAALG